MGWCQAANRNIKQPTRMSAGQWDTEDGDMWNSPTSQDSSSSCNSWGNGPKKGPSKVREQI